MPVPEPGMAKNTYGTGCFMLMHTGKKAVESQNGLLTTIAWGLNGEIEYALERSRSSSLALWCNGCAMDCACSAKPAIHKPAPHRVSDNGGVYAVPAFVGLGAPYWRSDVRGAVFGLTRSTTKEHFVRAALESMAYQTRDVLSAMQADADIELKELRTDGAAITNDFMAQFRERYPRRASAALADRRNHSTRCRLPGWTCDRILVQPRRDDATLGDQSLLQATDG